MPLTPAESAAAERLAQYNPDDYHSELNPYGQAGEGYEHNFTREGKDLAVYGSAVLRESREAVESATSAATSETAAASSAQAADGSAAAAASSEQVAEEKAQVASEKADLATQAASEAAGYAAGLNLPAIQPGDSGKALTAKPDLSGFQLSVLEGVLPAVGPSDAGKVVAVRADLSGYELMTLPGVPSGLVCMWSGTLATVPAGWRLCDGTNGTPNLFNCFIIGASADTNGVATADIAGTPQQTGGSITAITDAAGTHAHTASMDSAGSHSHGVNSTTLSLSQIPSHTHTEVRSGTAVGFQGGPNSALVGQAGGSSGPSGGGGSHSHSIGSAGNHTHGLTVDEDGSHTHDIETVPPFYALAFIIKD